MQKITDKGCMPRAWKNQIAAGHPTLKGRVCFGPSADFWGI